MKGNSQRDLGLDVLRGLAVVFMVNIHLLNNVLPDNTFLAAVMKSFGPLAASFFLICAGAGNAYLQHSYANSPRLFRRLMFQRGLFLVVFASFLGSIASLLSLHYLDLSRIFDWDIFTLIGTMYIFIGLTNGLNIVAAVTGICVLLLIDQFASPNVLFILRTGSFPIIPGGAFFLFGLAITHVQLYRSKPNINLLIRVGYAVAAVLFFVILFLRLNQTPLPIVRVEAWTPVGYVAVVSLFFLLVNGLRYKTFLNSIEHLNKPLIEMGRLTFSLYYFQYLVLIIGVGFLKYLFGSAMFIIPTLIWFICLFTFISLMYLVVVVWARFDYKFSLEWFISKYISSRSLVTSSRTSLTLN